MRHCARTLVFLAGLCLVATVQTSVSAVQAPYLAGLRRLTESQYRNSIADVFSSGILSARRFEPDRRIGGLLAAGNFPPLSITPSGFEGYAKMADGIARQVVDEKNRAKLIACTPKSVTAPDRACASRVLEQYGLLLFRHGR